ncbi:MAG: DUF2283 domain-containing protein [Planctomycetes bacterium]|nr:DUF2283 domain-containing protein [Planctomycetota bacterium]
MKDRYLEVTFRKGKAVAAYLYLPRPAGAKSARTRGMAPGVLVDFDGAGKAIGIEITAPDRVTADQVNVVLSQLGIEPVAPEELAPLQAA